MVLNIERSTFWEVFNLIDLILDLNGILYGFLKPDFTRGIQSHCL
jgi:hypothetical protein